MKQNIEDICIVLKHVALRDAQHVRFALLVRICLTPGRESYRSCDILSHKTHERQDDVPTHSSLPGSGG